MEISRRKFHFSCSNIFFQPLQFGGAWDWNNPRFLREQPGKRDLGRHRLLAFRYLAKQINQSLVRFASLRCKTRKRVAKVRTVERRVFVNFSGEESSAQRTIRNETDPELLKRRQQ